MAEGKKSFVAYCDWIEIFEELEDCEAGQLAKHLFRYVNDLDPEAESREVKLCFIAIKQSLKRDLKKYEGYIDKQKLNGAKGGRPKKTQITQPLILKPKKADSVSVSDNVNEITTIYEKFVDDIKLGSFQTRIESLYMRLRIKEGSLTPLLKDFKLHIIEENRTHKDTNDFFINFKNWLNVQDRNKSLDKYKKN
jgi:hypothetical protein